TTEERLRLAAYCGYEPARGETFVSSADCGSISEILAAPDALLEAAPRQIVWAMLGVAAVASARPDVPTLHPRPTRRILRLPPQQLAAPTRAAEESLLLLLLGRGPIDPALLGELLDPLHPAGLDVLHVELVEG